MLFLPERFFTLPRALLFCAGFALMGCDKMISDFVGSRFSLPVADQETIASPAPSTPVVTPPVCDSSITTTYGGGAGSTLDPYRICSVTQWLYLANHSVDWSSHFKLEADLNFTGVTISEFLSIGNGTTAFTGTLDGGSKKITNLTLTGTTENLALFGKTNGSVTIQNLNLESVSIQSGPRSAILVLDHGASGSLTFSNISLKTVSLISTSTSPIVEYMGSLVGKSDAPVVITDVSVDTMTMTLANNSRRAGGIVGKATIVNATRLTVQSLNLTSSMGGGQNFSGLVSEIYHTSVSTFQDITYTGLTISTGANGAAAIVSRNWAPSNLSRVRVAGTISSTTGQAGLVYESVAILGPVPITISESSFVGNLPIDGNSATGGLIASVGDDITIDKSFHSGNVAVWSGTAGGLIGSVGFGVGADVIILDSYSLGTHSMTHATDGRSSGLVGRQDDGTLLIQRSYFKGSFTGTASGKSCIVDINGTTVATFNDVYYDSTVCNSVGDFDSALTGVSGIITAALQVASPLTNWLPSVWIFALGANPKLIWE